MKLPITGSEKSLARTAMTTAWAAKTKPTPMFHQRSLRTRASKSAPVAAAAFGALCCCHALPPCGYLVWRCVYHDGVGFHALWPPRLIG